MESGRDESKPAPLPDRRRPAHFLAHEPPGLSTIYFVTVCTKDRRAVLANDAAHEVLIHARREATWFTVGRYVIMPDHVHFFCAPAISPAESLARWMIFWKSISARKWPEKVVAKLWQRDFWDTQLRRGESYALKWEYVRNSPVRAGLATRPEEWPHQGELNTLWWHE